MTSLKTFLFIIKTDQHGYRTETMEILKEKTNHLTF